MTISKTLTTAIAAASLVGVIGFAYAQTTDTSPGPQQMPAPSDAAAPPQAAPGTTQSAPSSTNSNATSTTPAASSSSSDTMTTERAAQADRN